MSDARPATLGRYINVKHGFAFKGEYFTDEVTPDVLVTPGNFSIGGGFQDNKLKYYAGPVPDDYVLQSGDLVVTMTDLSKAGDTLGYPALVPESVGRRYLHNQRIGLIEIKPDAEADKRFLFYRLRADDYRNHILATASGSTVRHTSPNRICEFETTLPSIDDQLAIADVLSVLDDKLEQNQRTARALERLARAIFRAWFVDFEPVKAKGAGATSFPSMPQPVFDALPIRFVDSEIGPVPEGWDVSNIGTCSSYLSRGITPRYIQEGGVLVVNQKCIRDFMIDFTKARRHDRELKKIDGREIAVGDVLINSTGVGTLGRVAQVLNLPEPAVADSHVTVVRPSPTLSWAFLGQALMLKQPVIEAMGEGSTGQTELSRKKVSELLLSVPPNSVLSAFDETVVPLMRLISTALKESKKLAELRDLLLPKVLFGEVRVAVDVDRPEVLP